jgi:hypothetical protein
MIDRINAPASANGAAKRRKAPAKVPVQTKATPRANGGRRNARPTSPQTNVVTWAHRYTGVSIVLSALLNGWSAWQHQQQGTLPSVPVAVAAALVSAIVPALVWGLSQLAGWLYRADAAPLAAAAGSVGVGMLALSVWHVSEAISTLTGQHIALAALLAVGIDCGLVVSELSAIMVGDHST